MFRNPFGCTARIGSLFMGAALASASITPLFPKVSAAVRPTISPAPFIPSLPRTVAVINAAKPKRQNQLAGFASWYGAVLHGHRSANGDVFDETLMTAAQPSLPFGTMVRVLDLSTGRSVVVRITDRGLLAPDRIIDLSSAAADSLGILSAGVARVRLEVLKVESLGAKVPSE